MQAGVGVLRNGVCVYEPANVFDNLLWNLSLSFEK